MLILLQKDAEGWPRKKEYYISNKQQFKYSPIKYTLVIGQLGMVVPGFFKNGYPIIKIYIYFLKENFNVSNDHKNESYSIK